MIRANRAMRMALVVVLAGGLLAGCRGRQEDQAKYKVALVMKSLANEFFTTMRKGAEAHQAKHATLYSLKSNGIQDETSVMEQIKIVEQMIDEKVDAIVLAPADSKALVPVCKKALDAGIVVVNIDNKLDADVLKSTGISVPFVGPDNREGARLAGEHLAAKLTRGDEVLIVEGKPNAYNGEQRKLGFQDAMKAAGLVIVDSQSGEWMTDKAETKVTGMLAQHANVKAVLCANDSMAMGAVTALRDAGKLGKVLVVGFDNISAVQEEMKEGNILCTVDQHGDQIAVFGIEYALEILEKKITPADKKTPVDLVTK